MHEIGPAQVGFLVFSKPKKKTRNKMLVFTYLFYINARARAFEITIVEVPKSFRRAVVLQCCVRLECG